MNRPLRSAQDLVGAGLVPADRLPELERVAARYAVAITPAMAELLAAEAPDGPMRRQFVPSAAELETRPGELADPIGDEEHSPCEGLVHRYPDRVLLKPVQVCAVYCRFCFRRETVGPGKALSPRALAAALDYIRGRPQIWELILSGGDPLVMSPRRLGTLIRRLAAIAHVKVIRLHTRVPLVDPDRVTAALVAALRAEGAATWLVLHANHPDELTPAGRAALDRLADAGIPLLSQSVLLAGINDDAAVLERLLRGLVEQRVKPYYLHHADLAPGTSHLRTSLAEGAAIARALRGRVSGLCQPTYVLDIPGGHGKSPVGPAYLDPDAGTVEDWRGGRHAYPGGTLASPRSTRQPSPSRGGPSRSEAEDRGGGPSGVAQRMAPHPVPGLGPGDPSLPAGGRVGRVDPAQQTESGYEKPVDADPEAPGC